MSYRPPRGIRPPQLEGRRTGRPKGSKNFAPAWSDVLWGYENRFRQTATPPTAGAAVWWKFEQDFDEELETFLAVHDLI